MSKSGLIILTNPNPELRHVSAALSAKDIASPETQAFIDQLEIALHEFDGVGIAAPQVGMKKRIIVINMGETKTTTFINPEIVSKSFKTANGEEGCLSVPGIFGVVKRHTGVKLKALLRDGSPFEAEATGLLAVIFQHEIDHLNGVLFVDKVTKFTSAGHSRL